MPERKPFLLRIDRQVLDALQRWADADLRSLNGQIEFVLRRALEEDDGGATDGGPRRATQGSAEELRPGGLVLFEVGLDVIERAGSRPKRFAMIEHRRAADMDGDLAALGLPPHDDGDRTALHAFTKPDETPAGQARLETGLLHSAPALGRSAFTCSSNHSFVADPGCLRLTVPSGLTNHVTGMKNTASYVSRSRSCPRPTSTG